MRSVEVSEYGDPDVLRVRTGPDPTPEPGQVRIAVEFAEVLFLDTQLRQGWGEDYFPMRPPWVPGTGVAGRIDEVGDGVDAAWVGERVIARTGNDGGYAERVVVAAEAALTVPGGLDLAVATAALHDGVLALDRLEQSRITAGTRVLVTAAAGSLGQWFVPLAKAAGAHVTGAAGGARKTAAVAEAGADAVLDYRADGWEAQLAGPYDVVFDGTGGAVGRAAFAATADGGMVFGHGAASGAFTTNESQRDITIVGVERQLTDADWVRLTHEALVALVEGRVRPVIGQRVRLERAADAHSAIADRTVLGKTLLTVDPAQNRPIATARAMTAAAT